MREFEPQLSRRLALGLVAGGLSTGCLSRFDRRVELGALRIQNLSESRTDVAVQVTLDGEVVHASTTTAEPAERNGDQTSPGEVFLDCTWPSERGEYVVNARRAEADDWMSKTVAEGGDDDCYVVTVRVEESESLYVESDPYCDLNPELLCEEA